MCSGIAIVVGLLIAESREAPRRTASSNETMTAREIMPAASSVRVICHVNLDGPLEPAAERARPGHDHSHKRELWLPLNAVGRRCPVSGELVVEGARGAQLVTPNARSSARRRTDDGAARLVIGLAGLSTGTATLELHLEGETTTEVRELTLVEPPLP